MIEACTGHGFKVGKARHSTLDDCHNAEVARDVAARLGAEPLGLILQLTAMADGDYCDLGEAVTNLLRHRADTLEMDHAQL